ncbi:MAG: hypothetical protein M1826_005471 [Phylliscum demangeonii]|nr:MAG: hypothetical protein M1826_005471 [Phylliscum demangeonii]
MRFLQLLPVWLAVAVTTSSLLIPRANSDGEGEGDRVNTGVNKDGNPAISIDSVNAARKAAIAFHLSQIAPQVFDESIAQATHALKLANAGPLSKMVIKVKKNWHGPGGKLFRKVLGKWSEWDRTECFRRKSAELFNQLADMATSREWDRICGSRKTAEADEKKPWIGKL